MHTSKSIKNTAKAQLAQNWSKAYAAMAIILMVTLCVFLAEQLVNSLLVNVGMINDTSMPEDAFASIANFSDAIVKKVLSRDFFAIQLITIFFVVFRFLVISPLKQGNIKWYYSVAKGSKTYLTKLFLYYHSNSAYISLLLFKISFALRKIAFGVISFAASIASLSLSVYQFSAYVSTNSADDKRKAILYLIIAAFLFFLGLIMYLLLTLKYFLADYLFVSLKDFNGGFKMINSCFSLSKEMMNGQWGRVISLGISFIPLILSCIFIFPILYVYPYMQSSFAALARSIIKTAKNKESKVK